MANRGRNREVEGRSESEPHEEFLELCALSTSGDLTAGEQKELHAHLSECEECRQVLKEFEAAVDVGVPLLSSKLGRPATEQFELGHAAPVEPARLRVPARDGELPGATTSSEKRTFAFAHRSGHQPTQVNWNYVWLPFAACVLLSAALATYTYRVGRGHRSELISTGSFSNAGALAEGLKQQVSDAGHERQALKAQLVERDRVIAKLRGQIEQQASSIAQMKVAQTTLDRSIQNDQAEKQRVAEERSGLSQKLDAAQASIQKMQAELESARQQRSESEAEDASLQTQIMDLNGQLRDREQTLNKQDDLLSHDRDIRDLMGARDLYIAEVYDVGRDGATQKPFGRIFYTKGKSLIFYAYDLDQQSGIRNARSFQAWGRRGADMQQALNLGVFYEDSTVKKRWVLKFNDPKALEQINAVFVTVEPTGGSEKPSGKPLLFTYLKIEPNHP